MKHKYRIWAHQVVKQWEVTYWETYALVVNWISVMSLLDIASINELESISIEYVPTFTQYYIDADVFMDITLGTGVYENRGEWVLKLNKSLYGLKQSSENWFDLIINGIARRVYHQY